MSKRTLPPGSFLTIPARLARDSDISHIAVRVVLLIRSYPPPRFPSFDTMARTLKVSRSTIIRAVGEAKARGYLATTAGKGRHANGYVIQFATTEWSNRSSPQLSSGVTHDTSTERSGVTGGSVVVSPMTPESEYESKYQSKVGSRGVSAQREHTQQTPDFVGDVRPRTARDGAGAPAPRAQPIDTESLTLTADDRAFLRTTERDDLTDAVVDRELLNYRDLIRRKGFRFLSRPEFIQRFGGFLLQTFRPRTKPVAKPKPEKPVAAKAKPKPKLTKAERRVEPPEPETGPKFDLDNWQPPDSVLAGLDTVAVSRHLDDFRRIERGVMFKPIRSADEATSAFLRYLGREVGRASLERGPLH